MPNQHSGKRWIFFNWSALLCFEIVFHCLFLTLVLPLYRGLLQLALRRLDIPILSWGEFGLLLGAPSALLAQGAALLLLLFCMYWDACALFYYCDKSLQRQRLSPWRLWLGSLKAALPVLRPKGLPLLLLLPLLFFSICPLAVQLSQPLQIPTPLLDLVLALPLPLWGTVALPLAVTLLLLPALLGLPAALDGGSALDAYGAGVRLLRRRSLPWLGRLLAGLCLCALAILAVTAVAVCALAAGLRLFYGFDEARYLFRSTLLYWDSVWALWVLLTLALTAAAQFVSRYRRSLGQVHAAQAPPLSGLERVNRVLSLVGCAALLVFLCETGLADALRPTLPVTSTVVAHRGASAVAPENTLPAVEAAVALRADMVEIDVRQSADQAFVVIHDANCRRVSGVDQKVADTLLKDLETLDVGVSFSPDFAGTPIPTLREVLALAKDRITLMIEVKSSGRNQEARLLRLIREYDMLQQCIIASKDLNVLKQVKSLAPTAQTVYIASYLRPADYALSYVDGYSVRLSSLSRETTIRLRAQGKPIYGWTANSPLDIRRLLLCDVDGVVTDDVPLVQAALSRRAQPAAADWLTQRLFPETRSVFDKFL